MKSIEESIEKSIMEELRKLSVRLSKDEEKTYRRMTREYA